MLSEYNSLLDQIENLAIERKQLDAELSKIETDFKKCAEKCVEYGTATGQSGRECYVLYCKKAEYEERDKDWDLRWDDLNQQMEELMYSIRSRYDPYTSYDDECLPF